MKAYPVRWNVPPHKLLGWLPCPDPRPHPGQYVTFMAGAGDRVVLRLDVFVDGGMSQLAYQSDNTPIDVLRRIDDFVEFQPRRASRL